MTKERGIIKKELYQSTHKENEIILETEDLKNKINRLILGEKKSG